MGRSEDVDQVEPQPRRVALGRLPRRPGKGRQEPSGGRAERDDQEYQSLGRCRKDMDTRRRMDAMRGYDGSRRPERLRLLGRSRPFECLGRHGLCTALPRERPFSTAAALLDTGREDAGENPQGEYQLRQMGGRRLRDRHTG